jgi:hypothetical protein
VLLRATCVGTAGWPNGSVRGPPIDFTSPSDLVLLCWAVAGPSKEEDMLIGYELVPAMPQPDPAAHARLSRTASRCASLTSGIPHEMLPPEYQFAKSFVNRNVLRCGARQILCRWIRREIARAGSRDCAHIIRCGGDPAF